MESPHSHRESADDAEEQDNSSNLRASLIPQEHPSTLPVHRTNDINPLRVRKSDQLTIFSAFALLVGSEIGSGIFSSPSEVDNHVPSPGAAIFSWLLAGLIAWTGAASFAELGAAIPKNGGMQEYLGYIYGDFLASVMSWTWIMAVKPASMAILSLIFAEYWTRAIFSASISLVWLDKILAIMTLVIVLLVNSVNITATTRLTNLLLIPKFTAIALIVVLALAVVLFDLNADGEGASSDWKNRHWFAPRQKTADGSSVDWKSVTTWELMGQYATSLYAGLWAYSGWDNANMVAGEIRSASRDLPRAIHFAIPTVICCFVLANISYYVILPWDKVGSSNTIAVTAGRKALGPVGGLLFALLVSASCLGSLNINVFTTGRLTVAAARQGYVPQVLGRVGDEHEHAPSTTNVHSSGSWNYGCQPINRWIATISRIFESGKTPRIAMAFNAVTTSLYILFGSFGGLVTFIGIAEYFFYFLTVLGALILRKKQPHLLRPYQPPIWTPIVFCVASFLLVSRGAVFAPVQSMVLCGLIVVGVVFHFLKSKG